MSDGSTESGRPAKEELAYAVITPYSLHKSRTGGIIARLLWADVRLVAARMYAPDPKGDFIRCYCDAIYDPEERDIPLKFQKMLIEYVVDNLSLPNERNISNRALLLLFKGPNAIEEISNAVGHIGHEVVGDNVRGTYGEFVREERGPWFEPEFQDERNRVLANYPALQKIEVPERRKEFFEPAVITGRSRRLTIKHLKLFRDTCYSDSGNVVHALKPAAAGQKVETSVVILKPESFRTRDPMPGNLIDFFARTGMFITAARILRFDLDRAKEFYGAKIPQFRRQLKGMVSDRAKVLITRARTLLDKHEAVTGQKIDPACRSRVAYDLLGNCEALYTEGHTRGPSEVKEPVDEGIFKLLPDYFPDLKPDKARLEQLAEELKDVNAEAEFNELIGYMTSGPCMVLLYSGPGALGNIRVRLKELRKIYGYDILHNRAHASDPDEEPDREKRVVGFPLDGQEERPCDVEREINECLDSMEAE